MNDKKKMDDKDKNRTAACPFRVSRALRPSRVSRVLRMFRASNAFPIFRMFPEQGIFISNRPFQGPERPGPTLVMV